MLSTVLLSFLSRSLSLTLNPYTHYLLHFSSHAVLSVHRSKLAFIDSILFSVTTYGKVTNAFTNLNGPILAVQSAQIPYYL